MRDHTVGKRRHLARRLALQILYANHYTAAEPSVVMSALVDTGEISDKNWTPFCQQLTGKVIEERERLDASIAAALNNWRIERLSVLDHIILLLALCEMRSFPDIPVKVTLNEYIELAKEYGTDDSASFINGILDHLSKPYLEKDGRISAAAEASDDLSGDES
jgi:N utilization substance protein B